MNVILTNVDFDLRYVHDIVAAFDNEQDLLNFLDFLNNRSHDRKTN